MRTKSQTSPPILLEPELCLLVVEAQQSNKHVVQRTSSQLGNNEELLEPELRLLVVEAQQSNKRNTHAAHKAAMSDLHDEHFVSRSLVTT